MQRYYIRHGALRFVAPLRSSLHFHCSDANWIGQAVANWIGQAVANWIGEAVANWIGEAVGKWIGEACLRALPTATLVRRSGQPPYGTKVLDVPALRDVRRGNISSARSHPGS